VGEIRNFPLYFIDMELCEINLAHYIYRIQDSGTPDSLPQFIRDAPSSVKATQIWNVMYQITSGLAYIHENKEVHRDLKPENGWLFII